MTRLVSLWVLLHWSGCLYAAQAAPSATDAVITRIAFGSCAFQWAEQPIYRTVVALHPDLYLSLGDAIYGDYDGEKVYAVTPLTLRREWKTLSGNPDWQYLSSRVPIMATWDNHDYGHHSAGEEFSLKEESSQLFLDFFAEPADSERRHRPGIYTARSFGPEGKRVQLVLLDTRSFKSPPVLAERPAGAKGSLGKYAPNADPAATLLGEAQWQWLEQQLSQTADLRLLASSGQIVADQKGMDEWGNYPLERQRLFNLIEAKGVNVVLLSGNAHFSEISALNMPGNPLVDFTSSGLTHVNKAYASAANPYRVAGPYADLSFGLIEIDWEAQEGTTVTLSAIDIAGNKAFEYTLKRLSN